MITRKILKAARETRCITYKRTKMRMMEYLSLENNVNEKIVEQCFYRIEKTMNPNLFHPGKHPSVKI